MSPDFHPVSLLSTPRLTHPLLLLALHSQAGSPSYRYRICKHMLCRPGVTYRNVICMITLWANNINTCDKGKCFSSDFHDSIVNCNYENCRALRKHLYCSHDLFSWDFSVCLFLFPYIWWKTMVEKQCSKCFNYKVPSPSTKPKDIPILIG